MSSDISLSPTCFERAAAACSSVRGAPARGPADDVQLHLFLQFREQPHLIPYLSTIGRAEVTLYDRSCYFVELWA